MPAPWNPVPWNTEATVIHAQLLLDSFRRCASRSLLELGPDTSVPDGSQEDWAQRLFEAPFVVVSHGTQADPIFNYGNRKALELWELSWEALTQMPSRKTAEPELRGARSQMLAEALQKGYVDRYEGIRISSTGRRFRIRDGMIWNVEDDAGRRWGQAATFSRYEFLE